MPNQSPAYPLQDPIRTAPITAPISMGGLTRNLRRHRQDYIMSKLHILTAAAALLGVYGCAQQPSASGPLPLPMTQTASTDWTVAVQPDGTLGQSDDDGDGATLEDRARSVLGNKPL